MAKRFRAEGGGFSGLWEVFVARLVSSEVEGSESLGFVFFVIFLRIVWAIRDSSPSNHHLGEDVFTFFRHFMQNPRIVANLWYQMFLLNKGKDFFGRFLSAI